MAKKPAHWFLLERVQASLERFKAGLGVLGVFDAMCMHREQFKDVFRYSSNDFSADTFGSIFSILRSEEGSNKCALEGLSPIYTAKIFLTNFLCQIYFGRVDEKFVT